MINCDFDYVWVMMKKVIILMRKSTKVVPTTPFHSTVNVFF